MTYDGIIRGVIPFVRDFHRHFKVAHLPAKPELLEKYPELPCIDESWYVYFYDGIGAICCVKLNPV